MLVAIPSSRETRSMLYSGSLRFTLGAGNTRNIEFDILDTDDGVIECDTLFNLYSYCVLYDINIENLITSYQDMKMDYLTNFICKKRSLIFRHNIIEANTVIHYKNWNIVINGSVIIYTFYFNESSKIVYIYYGVDPSDLREIFIPLKDGASTFSSSLSVLCRKKPYRQFLRECL